jgi:hypothetical protein
VEVVERQRLVRMYQDGYSAVTKVLEGIDAAGWEAREAPGEWCPRQVVHHLGDSEMNAAIRIRRVIAEDNPLIQGYDEEQWAARLHYDLPIESALAAFKYARKSTSLLLHSLTEEEWARPGQHSQFGMFGAIQWLEAYGPHAHDHADQIRRAREAN